MLVPSYAPEKSVETDKELAGYFTTAWRLIFTNLLIEMQRTLSNEGFVPPSLEACDIAKLVNAENGTLIYDSTNDLMKVNIAGTFKTIVTI